MLGSASKITVSRTAKAWSTFQRNTRGLRWLVRYQLIFCVVLILTLPFAWVLIKSSCSDMIETTFAGECAAATNGTACLAMRAGFVSTGDDPHVAPECVWVCLTLVGSQVSGPQVCPESVVDGSCTTIVDKSACETLIDAIEYLALFVLISLMAYSAWISNSYALTIEGGVGKSINSDDGADEEKPPELELPATDGNGSID